MNYEQEIQEMEHFVNMHYKSEMKGQTAFIAFEQLLALVKKMQEEIQDLHTSINAYDDFKCYLIAELARTKQNWIPCSERLPKENLIVECTLEGEDEDRWIERLAYYEGKWHSPGRGLIVSDSSQVIAWMPLPEPFKGDV